MKITKPVFNNSFSVDDIHKLREYHYEKTKNLSTEAFIKDIHDRAKKFKEDLQKNKENGKKLAI